jgi:sugar O-acyltransferase (sialic acid O-acetyltransferase NeuD family)
MKQKDIILIGGGGHCKACIDVIEAENKYRVIGIIDLPEKKGQELLGYKVIANDDDIPRLARQGNNFLITVGHTGNPLLRNRLYTTVKDNGGHLPIIISTSAYVSKHAKISQGTIIMHKAIINADAQILENCIINNNSLIEHETIIENNVHISTGAIINGNCKIGFNSLVGSGSIIKQQITVAKETIIGAGSVVIKNIINSGTYIGVPAKLKANV